MNTTNGALSFDSYIENSQFKASIAEMQRGIAGLTRTVTTETRKMDDTFSNLGKLAAGAFAFNQLGALPGKLIQVRGEFQQLEIAFTTMLGNKSKADKLFADVVKLAATTPFDLKGVANGAKQLLAYGVASTEVTSTLTKLGDIAAGLSIPLGDLTYLYGTTKTQGRLFAADLNQFVGRGIPLIQMLAEQFGVAESEVKGLVEQGKVGFPEVEKAINKLTSSGGMFAGLMEQQSKSLTGLYSNLQDAIEQAFNEIGRSQEGILADSLKFGTSVVKNYEPILEVLTVLIATYGAYRAAVVATAVVQSVSAAMPAIQAFASLAVSIRSAADAQALFNLVTKANPYVIAATALVALITAVALFRDTATEAEKAQSAVADSSKDVERSMSGEIAKIQSLTTQIKNQNASNADRQEKLKELIALNPKILNGLTLENIATKDATTAINGYIESRKKQIELDTLKQQLDQSIQRQLSAKNGDDNVSTFDKLGAGALQAISGIKYTETLAKLTKQTNQQIIQDENLIQNQILDKIKLKSSDDSATTKSSDINKAATKKTVASIDEEIKKLKEQQETTAGSRTEYDKYQKQIEALEKQQRAITGELTKAQKDLAKDAEKVGPFGSLSYYDAVARKAQEIIDKTPGANSSLITAQTKIKLDAEKKAEDIRKSYAVKTFEEEIDEKRKQFELFQKWSDQYTQESAKLQFAGLVSENKSYLEFLNSEISKLESKKDSGVLSKTDVNKLDLLNSEKNGITGEKSSIDLFNEKLEEAEKNAVSLTDAIEELKRIQGELAGTSVGDSSEKNRIAVAEKILDLEKQRKAQLKSFIQEVVGSEQKRLEIEKYYNGLLIELDKKYADKSTEEYKKGRADIEDAKSKELRDQKKSLLEESESYKDLEKVIMDTGVRAIQDKINRTRRAMVATQQALGVESEEYKKLAKQLQGLELDLSSAKIQSFQRFAQIAGELGESLSEANGALGQMGKFIAAVASQAGNLSTVFDDNSSKSEKAAAGAQSLLSLVNLVVDSAKQRREAEKAYYNSVISQQMEYNLLLNEQIGLQSELNSNVFTTDFEGRLKDGFAQLKDATENYQDSLDALNEGMVKDGQRNAVDWGAVGQGAASGVAVGAAIGTVIPVIGNVVGAVVGGIVGGVIGLFAGKKKKDEFVGLLAEYPELIQMGADGQERLNKELAQTLIDNNLLDEKTKLLVKNAIEWQEAIDKARDAIKGVVSDLAGALGDDLRNSLVQAFEDGTDAAVAFGDSVNKVLENVLSNLIFNAVFKDAFDTLQKELIASSDIGGDGSWIDDFGRFYAQQATLINQFNDGLSAAQEEAQKFGLDIFTPDKAQSAVAATAQQGTVTGASAEAINQLNGGINAMRIQTAEHVNVARSQLFELTAIKVNTGATAGNTASMMRDLKEIARLLGQDFLRAIGG